MIVHYQYMDKMTSILKNLIIIIVTALANDNRRLQERNARLERNIRMVVVNRDHRFLMNISIFVGGNYE